MACQDQMRDILRISIHALREEGDLEPLSLLYAFGTFLSTPSARRATVQCVIDFVQLFQYFYPRPPRGGRRQSSDHGLPVHQISIHALREEGDSFRFAG